jgi:hypothetical protein
MQLHDSSFDHTPLTGEHQQRQLCAVDAAAYVHNPTAVPGRDHSPRCGHPLHTVGTKTMCVHAVDPTPARGARSNLAWHGRGSRDDHLRRCTCSRVMLLATVRLLRWRCCWPGWLLSGCEPGEVRG